MVSLLREMVKDANAKHQSTITLTVDEAEQVLAALANKAPQASEFRATKQQQVPSHQEQQSSEV